MLTDQEKKRYHRHTLLTEFGIEGQERLKTSSVLVIGAGGLGCPALQYLCAAGVGTIGIVDDDIVDLSNLQRQVLYTDQDIGASKALTAAAKLRLQNPLIQINAYETRLSSQNALDLFEQYDLILDGSDNFPTRYLVNDACVMLKKPFVMGSIYKFEAQIAVFNHHNGPTYRCVYPDPPKPGDVPNCSEIGVLGVLPGIVGCYQANEAIKVLTGMGETLSGKLMVLNVFTMESNKLLISLNPSNLEIDVLIDYEAFCNPNSNGMEIKEITATELKQRLDNNEDIQIIDVREANEYELCNMGGELISLGTIPDNADKISKDKTVVVHCHHGMRSANAIMHLTNNEGFTNLLNLKGGIHAWSTEVDPSVSTY
ncbi:MAG: molybdopterin-synthase adenylyltransferase MoeB [Flavobacteriales bacterium]|nr:molybdopterin-synthase adenylyltransferase MoeB [Flavobacteriales bacterium]